MAYTVEQELITNLLALCEQKSLKKVTLTELLDVSKVSRTAFNNRFRDLNDLICYFWRTRIVENSWEDISRTESDYYLGCLMSYKRCKKHKTFMIQALEIRDQNCLWDYINQYSINFELENLKLFITEKKLTEHQARFIASHHAYAIHNILLEWLKNDTGISTKELALMITHSRFSILNSFLNNDFTDIELH